MPAALILTLDAALDRCSVGLVVDGRLILEMHGPEGRGSAAALPALVRDVLHQARRAAPSLAAIAVTVGPGSFTGIRAAIAVAEGIGLAASVPVLGVTVPAALRATANPALRATANPALRATANAALRATAAPGQTRPIWVAIDSKRGGVFLDDGDHVATHALDALPAPSGPVAIAGNAAEAVATRLSARGVDVILLPQRCPDPPGIAAASQRPVPAQPLYVDPPQARPGANRRPGPT